jgi:hypothetical protein
MEVKILNALKWRMNPSTMNYWANVYMKLWDSYVEANISILSIVSPPLNNG